MKKCICFIFPFFIFSCKDENSTNSKNHQDSIQKIEEKVEETVDKESVTVEEFSEIVESDQEIVEITEDEIEPVEVANDIETNEKIVFEEEDILETLPH